jgi:hypothetical protein
MVVSRGVLRSDLSYRRQVSRSEHLVEPSCFAVVQRYERANRFGTCVVEGLPGLLPVVLSFEK